MKRHLSLILFLWAITAPFNNCDYVNSPGSIVDQASLLSQLAIQVAGPATVTVAPNVGSFNMGGTCSADIYPQSVIWWTIELNGQDVWDSYIAGGQTFLTTCLNGQFSTTVVVPCNNGVTCVGISQNYTLHLHIQGILATGQASGVTAVSNGITLVP